MAVNPWLTQPSGAPLPPSVLYQTTPGAPMPVVTGTQIPLDQAQILRLANQSANERLGIATDYAIAQGQLGLSQQELSQDYAIAQAQLQMQAQQIATDRAAIDAQYLIDREQIGLQAADFNWRSRMDVLNAKMNVLEMLAARSGPGDWVAYNYLLNGLSPPTPESSQSIDVFSLIPEATTYTPSLPAQAPATQAVQAPQLPAAGGGGYGGGGGGGGGAATQSFQSILDNIVGTAQQQQAPAPQQTDWSQWVAQQQAQQPQWTPAPAGNPYGVRTGVPIQEKVPGSAVAVQNPKTKQVAQWWLNPQTGQWEYSVPGTKVQSSGWGGTP